jgi:hypothetical protein
MLCSGEWQSVTDVWNSLLGPALEVGPTGCAETSLTNYQSTLHNIPEERRPHLRRGGSLKSRKDEVDPVHALKACRGVEVWLRLFLTYAVWSGLCPGRLTPRKTRKYQFNRSVGHRDGLGVLEKRKKDLFRLPTFELDHCTLQLILSVLCCHFRCYSSKKTDLPRSGHLQGVLAAVRRVSISVIT